MSIDSQLLFCIASYIVIALLTIATSKVKIIFSLSPLRATTIAITFEREPSKKKQRTDNKNDAKRIKRDNFTWSNRE